MSGRLPSNANRPPTLGGAGVVIQQQSTPFEEGSVSYRSEVGSGARGLEYAGEFQDQDRFIDNTGPFELADRAGAAGAVADSAFLFDIIERAE